MAIASPPTVSRRTSLTGAGRALRQASVAGRWLRAWLQRRRRDLVVLGPLVVLAGLVQGINMFSVPQRIDDEGTYVAQAWAIEHLGTLGHYTYWYDHPPLGWIQLAGWTWLTDGFDRLPNAVAAGREAMLVVALISVVLVWVLGRRLGLARWAAGIATAVFALSPLAVEFHRTVYLDNIAVPWLLGAFVLAASPRRRLADVLGAAACFAVAVLSKETFLLLFPVLAWQVWRSSEGAIRRYAIATATALLGLIGAGYVAYAAIKGELFPGPDHVSLVEGVSFQLFGRSASGSIFDPGSLAGRNISIWLGLDVIGPILALIAAPVVAWRSSQLRPIAAGFILLALVMLRPGYLPVPYVIAMIPLGALCIAGLAQLAADLVRARQAAAPGRSLTRAVGAGALAVAVLTVGAVAPAWGGKYVGQLSADLDAPVRRAEAWIIDNVPRDQPIIVDDAMWVDLVEAGFDRDRVVWYYKVDTDSEVEERYPGGWRDYGYVVSTESVRNSPDAFPDVNRALSESVPVAVFGANPTSRVEIRRIVAGGLEATSGARRQAAGARAQAGAELAANPAIRGVGDALEPLGEGAVDGRLLAVLGTLAAEHRLTVADIAAPGGEARGAVPRRHLEVAGVDGQPVDPTAPATADVIETLRAQQDSFAPAAVTVSRRADGTRPVLEATWPVPSPAALIPQG